MLNLDLTLLQSAERFQGMCARLAQSAFPHAAPMNFSSWDGGSDIVAFHELDDQRGTRRGDIVWQCKFTKSLGSNTKRAVLEALEKFDETYVVQRRGQRPTHRAALLPGARGPYGIERWVAKKWILCLPIDATGVFRKWLRPHLARRNLKWEIWGKTELLRRLEKRDDVVETYFYSVYEELQRYFATEDLQLVRMVLDKQCQWTQLDSKVLSVARSRNVHSPDLVFDIVVRNLGRVDTIIAAVEARVRESRLKLHGLPGEGLLFPQITYCVSIENGKPGVYVEECEPPLIVKANSVERFKVRITDTGYSWNGPVRLSLRYGARKVLRLPWWRLST